MPVYVHTGNPEFPVFQFDISDSEKLSQKWTITKRPVEDKGNVGDHIYREPFTFSSEGLVAWTPVSPRNWQPVPSNDPTVMKDAQDALTELANKEELVFVVSNLFTGQLAITSLDFSRTTADGWSERVAISFGEIKIAKSLTTTVDPSRLRPKVKRKAKAKANSKATPTGISDADKAKFLGDGVKTGKGSKLFQYTYGRG
jgi:hypothetical protein